MATNNPPPDSYGDGFPGLDEILNDPLLWDDTDSNDDLAMENAIIAAIGAEKAAMADLADDPDVTEIIELQNLKSEEPKSPESQFPADQHPDLQAPDSESSPFEPGVSETPSGNVVSLETGRRHRAAREPGRRRWLAPVAAGIAAAAATVAGFLAFSQLSSESFDTEVALAGTDLAPDAAAEVGIDNQPGGTRIILDVSNLDPAPPGRYYEAWLRKSPEVGVSAGTFHLRGGSEPIELWAGVSVEDYPLITVTLQDEAQTESSGEVVLKAKITPTD